MLIRFYSASTSNINKLNVILALGKKYEEKLKGTIIEKWIKYWKNVCLDYKEVGLDVIQQTKDRPLKAFGILSTFTFLAVCAKTNPNEVNFRDAVLRSTNDLLLVNSNLQRKESAEHLRLIEKCYNTNVIRRLNLGILSLMWIDNNSSIYNAFESRCSYLKIPYLQFHDRIIDVGFLNRWWLLENHMKNYDVNY